MQYILLLSVALLFICEFFSIILKLTGLDIKKARFQIISILTHTGFTTRESELIAQHPIRRKIISYLMLISYIAEIVLFSLLVTSIKENFNLIAIILCIVFLISLILFKCYKFFSNIESRLISFIAKTFMKPLGNKTIDTILFINDEYEVIEFIVRKDDYICNKKLEELKVKFIMILMIDKGEKIIPTPNGKDFVEEGDRIVAYGKTTNLHYLRNKKG